MNFKWQRPRGICKKCGAEVSLKAPTGNWLDALYLIMHRINGKVCDGTWSEVDKLLPTKAAQ